MLHASRRRLTKLGSKVRQASCVEGLGKAFEVKTVIKEVVFIESIQWPKATFEDVVEVAVCVVEEIGRV